MQSMAFPISRQRMGKTDELLHMFESKAVRRSTTPLHRFVFQIVTQAKCAFRAPCVMTLFSVKDFLGYP